MFEDSVDKAVAAGAVSFEPFEAITSQKRILGTSFFKFFDMVENNPRGLRVALGDLGESFFGLTGVENLKQSQSSLLKDLFLYFAGCIKFSFGFLIESFLNGERQVKGLLSMLNPFLDNLFQEMRLFEVVFLTEVLKSA